MVNWTRRIDHSLPDPHVIVMPKKMLINKENNQLEVLFTIIGWRSFFWILVVEGELANLP